MKKEEFYEEKWTFSCKMEELISRAARNPGIILSYKQKSKYQENLWKIYAPYFFNHL